MDARHSPRQHGRALERLSEAHRMEIRYRHRPGRMFINVSGTVFSNRASAFSRLKMSRDPFSEPQRVLRQSPATNISCVINP